MSYLQVDRGILSSSLWAQGTPEQIKVWFYLLFAADPRTGIVEDADPGIALRCGLSLPVTSEALDWLASPDPHSRTKDNEGRRIHRLPAGGFVILNYLKHRDKDHSTPRWRKWKDRQRTNGVGKRSNAVGNEEQEQEQTNTPIPPNGGEPVSTAAVTEVFEHWREVMGHPTAKLTPGRRKKLEARLTEGYTAAQLCEAVDGCRGSLFHMGANESNTVFDDLTLICRNGEKVEFFREKASKKPPEPEGTRGGLLTVEEQERRRREQWAKS